MKKILDDTGLSYFYGKMQQTFATQSSVSGKANSADLATVATSGSYNDLSNKPSVPAKIGDLQDNSNFLLIPDNQNVFVDMGLPSGILWATCDIDVTKPNGFCDTPFTYEKSFFSWGNIDGHNPTSTDSFSPWNWGGVNEQEPWYDGQVYGGTQGNTLTGNIAVGEEFDAARANLGAPWRMPTSAEFKELIDNTDYLNADGTVKAATETDKRSVVNGVRGIWLQSKLNGARLFFSCSGYGAGTSRSYRGSNGYYWSASFVSARDARNLYFRSSGVYPQLESNRCSGRAVRAVLNPSSLKASMVALTGNYGDLNNKPTIPTKVSDLTNDSGFIATTDKGSANGVATLDSSGKVPASQLPNGDTIHYVTNPSGTAGSTETGAYNRTQWAGSVDGITTLYTGLTILYKIPTAGVSKGVTLNINNLGEHPVVRNVTTSVSTSYAVDSVLILVYDADQVASVYVDNTSTEYTGCWKIADLDTNTTYSPVKLGFCIGSCTTSASTVTKTVSMSTYSLVTHGIVCIRFTKGISVANATLNINSTGAKSIYYKGAALEANVIKANDYVIMQYNSLYHIIGILRLSGIPLTDLDSDVLQLLNAISNKANSADLATVATSGSYNDLTNKPTIPVIWSGTQAQYDALSPDYDSNTIYIITAAS